MRAPHYCSLYPVFLESTVLNALDGSNLVLSTATGCLYKHQEHTYLITNWHVLSGLNALSRQPMHSTAATPSTINVHFPIDGNITQQQVCSYPLTDPEGNKLWLEHPSSSEVDVAALRIDVPANVATFPISNAVSAPGLGVREDFFYVSQDVWVIGFPKAIRVNGLPVWKRATIASEPRYSSDAQRHKILLDTATREGMSGSPVLFVNKSLTPLSFDGSTQEVDFPSCKVLLGIYSGRVAGNDELAAQIGIAWSADCIPEILSSGTNT